MIKTCSLSHFFNSISTCFLLFFSSLVVLFEVVFNGFSVLLILSCFFKISSSLSMLPLCGGRLVLLLSMVVFISISVDFLERLAPGVLSFFLLFSLIFPSPY